jgi:hypothetical protein
MPTGLRLSTELLEPESLCYITSRRNPIENTSIATVVAYCCRLYLATGCLPRVGLHWTVFIEPLPSNGSVRHNIYIYIMGPYICAYGFHFLHYTAVSPSYSPLKVYTWKIYNISVFISTFVLSAHHIETVITCELSLSTSLLELF